MIEGGFSDTAMGKMILAACFITDFGTVLALGTLFANYNLWLLLFVIVTLIVLWFMPRWTQAIITRLGATQVSEPEVKFIFFVLFLLGGLATAAKSEAVLPAYLLGLVVAGVFLRDKTLVRRMRSIAFAIFTPFYFINAGLYVSLPALWTSLLVISDRKETRHLRAGSIHAQDMSKLLCTTAPPATLLVRFSVGAVFLSEGMQKFLFADAQGAGRFAKIGIPAPDIMGPFVGCVEIVCGALLLIGLLTRLAAIPLMIDISVAIISTKVPILLGHGFWRFSLPKLANYGFWSMAHEARADFCMLLGSLFLLVVGAGKKWSLDARLTREHAEGIG